MKKIFYLLCTIVTFHFLYAQAPDLQWQKIYGGSKHDELLKVEPTSDGGYIAVGQTSSSDGTIPENFGLTDGWIIKMDAECNIQWQKIFGGSDYEYARCVQQTNDGGYIIVGATRSNDGTIPSNQGEYDAWVLKLSSNGDLEWQKTYGDTYENSGFNIIQTHEGGYIFTGQTSSIDGSTHLEQISAWIVKLSPAGDIQWEKKITDQQHFSSGTKIIQLPDDSYVTFGNRNMSIYNVDFWVSKLTSSGDVIWQHTYGGSFNEYVIDVSATEDGGFLMAGSTGSDDGDITGYHGITDIWLVKVDASGLMQWQKTYGGSAADITYAIIPAQGGGFLVAGSSKSVNGDVTVNKGIYDIWIFKINSSGDILWQKTLGGSSVDNGRRILQTQNGGYLVFGQSYSSDGDITLNHGIMDVWIAKLQYNLGTSENQTKTKRFILYPNPASDFVYIDDLPNESIIQITDRSGRELFRRKYTDKKTAIPVSSLTNDIYLINVQHKGNIIFSDKLMIKK